MAYDICDDILKQSGFDKIGSFNYRFNLDLWWNPTAKVHIVVFQSGSHYLLVGTKDYYLRSITEQGQTWSRDISAFYDYLENHFRELRIGFSFSRDVSPSLAQKHVQEKFLTNKERNQNRYIKPGEPGSNLATRFLPASVLFGKGLNKTC